MKIGRPGKLVRMAYRISVNRGLTLLKEGKGTYNENYILSSGRTWAWFN